MNHSLTAQRVSGFHNRAMNAMTTVQVAPPVSRLECFAVIRPVMELKWRVVMIRAAFRQEEFR